VYFHKLKKKCATSRLFN